MSKNFRVSVYVSGTGRHIVGSIVGWLQFRQQQPDGSARSADAADSAGAAADKLVAIIRPRPVSSRARVRASKICSR